MTTEYPDESFTDEAYGRRNVQKSIRAKLSQLPRVDANGRPLAKGEQPTVINVSDDDSGDDAA